MQRLGGGGGHAGISTSYWAHECHLAPTVQRSACSTHLARVGLLAGDLQPRFHLQNGRGSGRGGGGREQGSGGRAAEQRRQGEGCKGPCPSIPGSHHYQPRDPTLQPCCSTVAETIHPQRSSHSSAHLLSDDAECKEANPGKAARQPKPPRQRRGHEVCRLGCAPPLARLLLPLCRPQRVAHAAAGGVGAFGGRRRRCVLLLILLLLRRLCGAGDVLRCRAGEEQQRTCCK